MEIYRAYKTELDLTNVQKTACSWNAGAARFAYNWGLSRKLESYQLGQKAPTAIDLHNELIALKKAEFRWMNDIHILSATIGEKAGRWYVSLKVKMETPDPEPSNIPIAGVDLGIHRMAQVSDGIYFENPHSLRQVLRKLKHLHRVVSRRQNGSANRQKAVRKLAKAHAHVANIRKNSIHQATPWLAKSKSIIMIEKLHIMGLIKNHHLAQFISDVSWHEFQRQLTYKGAWYGSDVRVADLYFPSTKRCPHCGQLKASITLDERVYH